MTQLRYNIKHSGDMLGNLTTWKCGKCFLSVLVCSKCFYAETPVRFFFLNILVAVVWTELCTLRPCFAPYVPTS